MSQQVAIVEQPPRLPSIQAGGQVRAIVPQDFDAAWRIANAVVKSGMAPTGIKTAEQAMVTIMHGMEVGMTPMTALQSIATINGRPAIFGDGALGLVQGSGLLEWHKEFYRGTPNTDDYTAVCEVKRKGDPEVKTGEFSIADAKRAALFGKAGPWQQYLKRMLKMRARGFALRDGFSDVLRGLHIAEEAQDIPARPAIEGPPPIPAAPASSAALPTIDHDPQTGEVWEDPPTAAAEPEQPVEQPTPIAPPPVEPPQGDPMDIPPALDRRTKPTVIEATAADVFDPAQWLKDLDAAFSGCEDMMSLGEEWTRLAKPHEKLAFPPDWTKAKAAFRTHEARIGRTNLDAG